MIESFVELMKERGPTGCTRCPASAIGIWTSTAASTRRFATRTASAPPKLMREHILQLADRYREIGAG